MNTNQASYQVLDQMLRDGHNYSQVWQNGDFTNHVTHVAESLLALGLDEQAQAFAQPENWYHQYAKLSPLPPAQQTITADTWKSLRGQEDLLGSFNIYFTAEAQGANDWREVITRYVPNLVSDPAADLFHGLIQVGHAIRALEVEDTPERRDELGRGLALWAAKYTERPARLVGTQTETIDVGIRNLERRIHQPVPFAEQITEAITFLNKGEHLGAIALSEDPHEAVVDIAVAMAELYLDLPRRAAVNDFDDRHVVTLHTITGSDAALRLLPYLDDNTQHELAEQLLVASAAVASTRTQQPVHDRFRYNMPTRDELNTIAAQGREAHVVKAIAASVELTDRTGNDVFLEFALHAARTMQPGLVRDERRLLQNIGGRVDFGSF